MSRLILLLLLELKDATDLALRDISPSSVMPFQLLNLGTVASLAFSRMFYTRTPRGQSELSRRRTRESELIELEVGLLPFPTSRFR